MMLVGLTGSIGMGKTETAKMFAALGVPTYDADAAVHLLYGKGGDAVGPIGRAFPDTIKDHAVDRAALSKAVLKNPEAFKKLESIIHPLVAKVQREWLEAQQAQGAKMVVLDIPLLFETGGEGRVDKVVVVSAPADVQRARVLAREGMSGPKFEAILAKQMPDAEKRGKADYVVDTSGGVDHAAVQVKAIVEDLKKQTDG
ncbi:dephospho-CoA kinase [bacterium AH-315-P15]|nr:dephospho-CoA kinase [bacterium AH-315-P15]